MLKRFYLGDENPTGGCLVPFRERMSNFLKDVETQFGAIVAKLIEGVLRMAAISTQSNDSGEKFLQQSQEHSENVRKMLVAMVDDVRGL